MPSCVGLFALAEGGAHAKGMATSVVKLSLPEKQAKGTAVEDREWSSNDGGAAVASAGEEGKQHKRRLSATTTTTTTAMKSQRKLEEERALAFDVVRRTLLAPVTHISTANGGRPLDPATFARFAKPAQEKVSDVIMRCQ